MSTVAVNKIEDLSANQNKGVLQVVSAIKEDSFTTTSNPTLVDITGMTVTLTPRSTDSKVLIMANCMLCVGTYGGYGCYVDLVRTIGVTSATLAKNTDGTTAALRASIAQVNLQNYEYGHNGLIFLDSPNTTSATTYKLMGYSNGGTFYLNRRGDTTSDGAVSTITAMEIQGVI
jgi:hypothetical protein